MLQKRRKVVIHSQARIFAVRLQKYFYLEKLNKGPLLPVDRVFERVAAALRLSTESVVRITESKHKKYEPTLSRLRKKYTTKKALKKQKTLSVEPQLDLNCDKYICNRRTDLETDIKIKQSNIFKENSVLTHPSDPPSRNSEVEDVLQDLANNTIKVNHLKIESNDSIDENALNIFATENITNDNTTDFSPTANEKVKESNKKNDTIYDKSGNFIISDNSTATCKICFKTVGFRTRNSHFKRCHPLSDNRVMLKCDLCDQSFIEHRLKRHIILMHGKSCLKCAYCRSDFPSKDTLKDHVTNCTKKKRQRITSAKEVEIIQCDLCGKQMQRASLKAHKDKIHFGLAPVCEHCGKSFGNRLRLMDHCRAKHNYEKLKCTRCDFQSSSQLSLENHMRKHDGIKPFICDECGVGFHGAYLLLQHRRTHTTEKAYKCDLCPSLFKSNNNLACHKATCHNATQFSCSCGKRFSCLNYAKRHMKKQAIGKHVIEKCLTIEPFDGKWI